MSSTSDSDRPLNRYSCKITQPKSQGASQAMLYATGLSEDDMHKAQIGIASMWWEGNPCNMHLLDLAGHVKQSVQDAGLLGLRFNTIGVSDGMSMYDGCLLLCSNVANVLNCKGNRGDVLQPSVARFNR